MSYMFQGVLRINIVEARDLIKQDIGGKSDPYVICTIGTQQFRTRTIYNNLNPVWNYWCEVMMIFMQLRALFVVVIKHNYRLVLMSSVQGQFNSSC